MRMLDSHPLLLAICVDLRKLAILRINVAEAIKLSYHLAHCERVSHTICGHIGVNLVSQGNNETFVLLAINAS